MLCITEHHLNSNEINTMDYGQYTLRAQYCRRLFNQGGAAIFIHNNIDSEVTELSSFCREKDLEICATKIQLISASLLILCVYRSPSGDFSYFLTQLENLLTKLYKPSVPIISCGDFNVNFLDQTSRTIELALLLQFFSLESIIKFPTRITPDSQSLIDNSFLDKKIFQSQANPVINGLSDHDGQLMLLRDINCPSVKSTPIQRRVMDDSSTLKFLDLPSYENWEKIFNGDDINSMFNIFLDTYLKVFQSCFPFTQKSNFFRCKPWITQGIKNLKKKKTVSKFEI